MWVPTDSSFKCNGKWSFASIYLISNRIRRPLHLFLYVNSNSVNLKLVSELWEFCWMLIVSLFSRKSVQFIVNILLVSKKTRADGTHFMSICIVANEVKEMERFFKKRWTVISFGKLTKCFRRKNFSWMVLVSNFL